jgi:hypothetical protein
MPTLNEIIKNHQFCAMQKQIRKRFIQSKFGNLINDKSFFDSYLSLYPFSTTKPLTYFNLSALNCALIFFAKHTTEVFDNLTSLDKEISHAIFSMRRKGSSWDREDILSLDAPRDLIDFENIWHPEYNRYCEHIFNNLIRIPIGVLGSLKAKNYANQNLPNRVEILRNNGLRELANGYNATVRNAISHGSVSFEFQTIKYEDKNNCIELSSREFARLFDSLVDVCHAIVIALLITMCKNHLEISRRGIESLPLGFRFLIIDGVASHQDFSIHSMVNSVTIGGKKQLNVYCSTSSPSRNAHLFESLNVCWNSQMFGGKGYDRFSVSIDCGKRVPTLVFLDGQKLLRARQNNLPLECARDVFEDSLLWYDTSKWIRRLHIWKNIFSLGLRLMRFQFHDDLRKLGLKVLSSKYFIKAIDNKSADKIRRLEAHVILMAEEIPRKEVLLDIVKHAIGKLRKKRLSKLKLGAVSKTRRRPSYVWIRLYRRDARKRTLLSSGWAEGNLLLQAEWISFFYRKNPVYVNEPDGVSHGIRIRFNPKIIGGALK